MEKYVLLWDGRVIHTEINCAVPLVFRLTEQPWAHPICQQRCTWGYSSADKLSRGNISSVLQAASVSYHSPHTAFGIWKNIPFTFGRDVSHRERLRLWEGAGWKDGTEIPCSKHLRGIPRQLLEQKAGWHAQMVHVDGECLFDCKAGISWSGLAPSTLLPFLQIPPWHPQTLSYAGSSFLQTLGSFD